MESACQDRVQLVEGGPLSCGARKTYVAVRGKEMEEGRANAKTWTSGYRVVRVRAANSPSKAMKGRRHFQEIMKI